MCRLNVLFNTPGYKPAYNIGGPIHSVSAVAERLVQRGHRVWVAASNSNLTERLDVDTERWHDVQGVQVRYFRMQDSWTKKLPLDYFRKSNADYRTPDLDSWIETCGIKFDVIHSQLPFVYSNRVCSAFAERYRVPYFYHSRGVFDPVRLRNRALKKRLALFGWELQCCRRASALIALTEYEKESYRKLDLTNRVEVIPNGIEIPPDDPLEWPLSDFPVSTDDLVVLFLSRLHPTKGADIAIEAFCRARRGRKNVRLVVAGPDEFEIQKKLADTVSATESAPYVHFAGPVHGETKRALLQRADAFVLPTESEGFSMAVLEALANRCAAVVTPGAYFPEIEDSNAGIVCERSVEAVAQALAALFDDPHRTAEMGENARKLAAERFDWDNIVTRLENLYLEYQPVKA